MKPPEIFNIAANRLHNPKRIYFDILHSKKRFGTKVFTSSRSATGRFEQIRVAQTSTDVTRVVLDLSGKCDVESSQLSNPSRLILEVRSPDAGSPPALTSRTGSMRMDNGSVKPKDADFEATPEASTTSTASEGAAPTAVGSQNQCASRGLAAGCARRSRSFTAKGAEGI